MHTLHRPLLRVLALVIASAVMVGVAASYAPADAGAAPQAPTFTLNSTETSFLRLLNQERVARGLPPLVSDGALAPTSRTWSGTMALLNSLLHDPSLRTIINSLGISWQRYGENVGRGGTVRSIHDAFMASSGHRANVLSPYYNRVGIGTVHSGSRIYVTVRFLQAAPISGFTGLDPCAGSTAGGVVAGDVDGNNRDDLVVNRCGTSSDRVLTGTSGTQFSIRPISVGGDYVMVAGDFDGDGRDNMLWYGPGTAPDYLSTWTGSSFSSTPLTVNGRYRPQVGDLDGDGRDDIVWYAPGSGPDYIWYGTSRFGRFDSRPVVVNGRYQLVAADLDADGRDDLVWYGPGTAPDYIHYSLGRGRYRSIAATANGRYRLVAGNFDGAAGDDLLWYAAGTAADYVWYGGTRRGSYRSLPVTVNGTYEPATGDFNGDRRTDVAWIHGEPVGSPLWLGTSTQGRFGDARISVG